MKLLVVLLAACGGARPADLANSQPAVASDGCPGAGEVWIASSDSYHGHEGWVVPVHHEMLASYTGVADYEKLDEAAAHAHGVARPPARLWLMFPDQPPCEATPGPFYAQLINEGPINHTYGFELVTACKVDAPLAVVVASVAAAPAAPASCRALIAHDVATRLGSDDQAGWHRPTAQTAIPPVLERALAPHACTPPDCEPLWAVTEIAGTLYEATRNWVTIPRGSTPDHQCDWDQQHDYGIYLVRRGTAARLALAGDVAIHRLFAVLADARGPRVLVTANVGEYATWDWGDPPRRVRYEKWMEPNEEDYASQGVLGPYCGP